MIDSGPEIPEVMPGIDVPVILARLRNNRSLLRSLLLEFERDFADAARKIRKIVYGKRRDDRLTAERMAHSIKGMAGNLAAQPLFDTASALEAGIREGDQEKWPHLTDRFEEALDQIVASIATLKQDEYITSG